MLTVDELRDHVKVALPTDAFAGLSFKKLLKALDTNNNGVLEQDEFVNMLEKAGKSSVDTSMYSKISGSLGLSGKKARSKESVTN